MPKHLHALEHKSVLFAPSFKRTSGTSPLETNLARPIRIIYTETLGPNNSTWGNLSYRELHMYKMTNVGNNVQEHWSQQLGMEMSQSVSGDRCGTAIRWNTTQPEKRTMRLLLQ